MLLEMLLRAVLLLYMSLVMCFDPSQHLGDSALPAGDELLLSWLLEPLELLDRKTIEGQRQHHVMNLMALNAHFCNTPMSINRKYAEKSTVDKHGLTDEESTHAALLISLLKLTS